MTGVYRFAKLASAVVALALCMVPVAHADLFFVVNQKTVKIGGVLTGDGNGGGMPVLLVPAAIAPLPFACGRNALCTPQSALRPGPPNYIPLGNFHTKARTEQGFRLRVPHVKPGAYKVVVWCRPCGGSLILAGNHLHQNLIVR
jgi:hypothetical protein